MKEAMFYRKLKNSIVQCSLCPHHCVIKPSYRGRCGVRENTAGRLYSLNYGKAVSVAIDPVEKKPLFHFMPGTMSYSIAAAGCNLFCEFCQNWGISQQPKSGNRVAGRALQPKKIVEDALAYGCKSISYTYTEPTIFFEYAYEIARLARRKGLKNIFVTNGYTTLEPIDAISRYLDAANVDLKGFSDEFYRKACGARLEPVLDAIERYHEKNVFLEITTLIVPGHNDSTKKLSEIAKFIAGLGPEIPWHVSRFYPNYMKHDILPTPEKTLIKAAEIGKKAGLKHVYIGNLPQNYYIDSYCPRCNSKIIERSGYHVKRMAIDGGRCMYCKEKINVIS